MRSIVVLMLLAIGAVTAAADECRELAHAKRAHVFIIVELDGPVFGYAELLDVRQAWRRSRTNWTPTVQGDSVADVRAKLARLMRDDVIANPDPPKITHDIFGETVDWGDRYTYAVTQTHTSATDEWVQTPVNADSIGEAIEKTKPYANHRITKVEQTGVMRKAWWNVDQWAPPPAKPSWRRKWETLQSRD